MPTSIVTEQISNWYYPKQLYIKPVVGTVGILLNTCTALVLSKRKMRSSINALLILISLLNTFTITAVLTYILHFKASGYSCASERDTLPWARYELFYAHFTMCVRGVAVFLTMAMAVWRCVALMRGASDGVQRIWEPGKVAAVALLCCGITGGVLIPNFMLNHIAEVPEAMLYSSTNSCNATVYTVATDHNQPQLLQMNLYIIAVMFKLFPIVLLTICSIYLFCRIRTASKRAVSTIRAQPTSSLLLAIVLTTMLFDMPHIFFLFYVGLMPEHMREYQDLGDFLDLLSLIQMQTTFGFYCSTSGAFRQTALRIFARMCCSFPCCFHMRRKNRLLWANASRLTDRSTTGRGKSTARRQSPHQTIYSEYHVVQYSNSSLSPELQFRVDGHDVMLTSGDSYADQPSSAAGSSTFAAEPSTPLCRDCSAITATCYSCADRAKLTPTPPSRHCLYQRSSGGIGENPHRIVTFDNSDSNEFSEYLL